MGGVRDFILAGVLLYLSGYRFYPIWPWQPPKAIFLTAPIVALVDFGGELSKTPTLSDRVEAGSEDPSFWTKVVQLFLRHDAESYSTKQKAARCLFVSTSLFLFVMGLLTVFFP